MKKGKKSYIMYNSVMGGDNVNGIVSTTPRGDAVHAIPSFWGLFCGRCTLFVSLDVALDVSCLVYGVCHLPSEI